MPRAQIYNALPDATLVCSIVAASILDRTMPIADVVPAPFTLLGWPIALLGFGFAIYIIAMLRRLKTSSDATVTPSQLITSGPFAFSRNPFYLAYIITALGAAIILGSLVAYSAPILCFVVLHTIIIPVEEKAIYHQYGQGYVRYTQRVRRWL